MATFGARSAEGKYDASLFCRNCIDETYFTFAVAQSFNITDNPFVGPLGAPRTVGVKLKVNF